MTTEQETDAATALQALHDAYRAYEKASAKSDTITEQVKAWSKAAYEIGRHLTWEQYQARDAEGARQHGRQRDALEAAMWAQRRVWAALHAYMETQEKESAS